MTPRARSLALAGLLTGLLSVLPSSLDAQSTRLLRQPDVSANSAAVFGCVTSPTYGLVISSDADSTQPLAQPANFPFDAWEITGFDGCSTRENRLHPFSFEIPTGALQR